MKPKITEPEITLLKEKLEKEDATLLENAQEDVKNTLDHWWHSSQTRQND